MNKQTASLLVVLLSGIIAVQAQIDTVGVYYLTDGGGDPTIKSAFVYADNIAFTDYTRIGVTPSSGSGFFVSKGFPFGGADYDEGKYHTFTVTPQNDATLYIKKFSMNHKRSGSNPNPGNTVNFKCVVQYEDKEYVFGTGTTLNPTAWFYADNLKILTKSPVTFKLYAKDLFDASQSWMQRRVSIIGASIPSGVDPEDVIGPLEPTYTEVPRDYVNPLTFFSIEAEGQLAPPYIYDMAGMPLNYVFMVKDDANLSDIKFNYTLPAGTTLQAPLPSDFSNGQKHTVVLQSSWGTRKAGISVKKINAADSTVKLNFGASQSPHDWTTSTMGWIAGNIATTETNAVRFDKEDASFVVANLQSQKTLSFDIKRIETTAFNGIFMVESSANGTDWEYLYHFNACNQVPTASTTYTAELISTVNYVRFNYAVQLNRHQIEINNITFGDVVSAAVSADLKTALRIYPNPAVNFFNIESEGELNELLIYSSTGMLMKKIVHPGKRITLDGLNKGIYFCRLTGNSGSISTLPLAIQ